MLKYFSFIIVHDSLLFQCVNVPLLFIHFTSIGSLYCVLCLVAQWCLTQCDPMDRSPPGSSVHGDCPGKNTGVGCPALLQGISPTQGSNLGLLHCGRILYCLSHQGSPWILGWVAYPFSRGSSQSRNWTGVSCIAGGFFTSWATREAHWALYVSSKSVSYSFFFS